jgi:hypothetical protein
MRTANGSDRECKNRPDDLIYRWNTLLGLSSIDVLQGNDVCSLISFIFMCVTGKERGEPGLKSSLILQWHYSYTVKFKLQIRRGILYRW